MSLVRRVVSIHYILRHADGGILDTSRDRDPVIYLEDAGMIIDGLDEGLREAQSGDRLMIEVSAAKGYGEWEPSQVQTVPRDRIPVPGEIKVGDHYQTASVPGSPVVTVVGVQGDQIQLDANHPLAGVNLSFEVEVMQTRVATDEEVDRGRPLPRD